MTETALTTTDTALTSTETAELARHEATIERGFRTFVEVGNALKAIRDDRLYRATYETFEDYCRDRWGMSKTHANRQIAAAEVIEHVTPIGVTPINEGQARPLTQLEPEQQREVWAKAVAAVPAGQAPTGKVVEEIVREIKGDEAAYRLTRTIELQKYNNLLDDSRELKKVRGDAMEAIDVLYSATRRQDAAATAKRLNNLSKNTTLDAHQKIIAVQEWLDDVAEQLDVLPGSHKSERRAAREKALSDAVTRLNREGDRSAAENIQSNIRRYGFAKAYAMAVDRGHVEAPTK